ncbi:2-succinyl-6-hydroxy-2,4-cyclohexadiene-1-carboxylate synthase [Lentibacillus halodurans]|uniref:Putative 2-succinyl-6-hydroxy-2,4-cyclohexadiene-1-carboxylate synthase n=1 Tax=Lentibacillus halodurans TaxID=237679 RepID=A0A1I0WUG2_9BACI|nr:2-succinyl-6-hydroxy-2,4-cyclohexadiene-1-carboxylate synthase [Lentibacillus halodurans]SFA91790.1 2-succinyl-6-hydroxy-2,4-cyclohexadiene-1-carboxylate synthase [Lentibacillus halodurans]
MYLTVNDTAYWYELNGDGEPVVFLHGFTGTTGTWANIVNNMMNDCQTLTIDLPGHGKTDINPPKTMEAFCWDLARLLDYLQWENVHLIGYSMGGRTALSFALVYPERVKSLTLESTSPGLADKEERQNRRNNDEKLAQRIEAEGIEAFVKYWENMPLFQSQQQLPEAVRETIRTERLSHSEEGLAQSLRFMGTGAQPSWWEKLQHLNTPVLLVTGELDRKFMDINKAMVKLMPSADHVTVKNSGHAIHVEQHATFGKIVNGFLHSIQ